jgi:hypothetical protein
MAETEGKREIEAICDTFQGGLEGYLVDKIGRRLEDLNNDAGGIDVTDLDMEMTEVMDDIDNDDKGIEMDDMDTWDLGDNMDYGDHMETDNDITDDMDGIYDF